MVHLTCRVLHPDLTVWRPRRTFLEEDEKPVGENTNRHRARSGCDLPLAVLCAFVASGCGAANWLPAFDAAELGTISALEAGWLEATMASARHGMSASVKAAVSAVAPPAKVVPNVAEIARGAGPLRGEAHRIFWGTTEDPPSRHLDASRPELEGRHYLRSDEKNHHLFRALIDGLGGAYAGVGAEQAYTFASWSRARLVWLTDYDPWIVEVHRIYHALILASPDVETFRARFEDDERDASFEIVRACYEGDSSWDLLSVVYDSLHWRAGERLQWMAALYDDRGIPSWVNDREYYRYVRTLIKEERVRPMLANLLDETALNEIGRASRELGVPIRVFYLSNAETYWDYPDQYRANMAAQYFDSRSLILRTDGSHNVNGDYRYGVQPAANYLDWLRNPAVENIRDIWRRPRVSHPTDLPFELVAEPAVGNAARGIPLPADRPFLPLAD